MHINSLAFIPSNPDLSSHLDPHIHHSHVKPVYATALPNEIRHTSSITLYPRLLRRCTVARVLVMCPCFFVESLLCKMRTLSSGICPTNQSPSARPKSCSRWCQVNCADIPGRSVLLSNLQSSIASVNDCLVAQRSANLNSTSIS